MKSGSFKVLLFNLIFLLSFTQCSILKDVKQLSKFQKNNYQLNIDTKGGKLEHMESYPVIHLYGTPEEMGQQYGLLLKPQLKALFHLFESVFSKEEMDEYLDLGSQVESSLPYEVKSEIRAISVSSGVDYDLLIAMNVATKVDCSTLAVWGDYTLNGDLIMGRNADYETRGLNKLLGLIVVRHPDKGLATINVSYIGMIGSFSGVNENGICFGNMLSYNAKSDSTNVKGMPIQMVLRIAGEKCKTLEEYTNFLLSQEYMIPNIVMAADNQKAIITENSQFKSILREAENEMIASTNFFHTQSVSKEYKSDDRYPTIVEEVQSNAGEISVKTVKSIMHKVRKKKTNVQCIVFEPGKKQMHVSINKIPASKGPFKTFTFDSLLN